MPNKNKFNIDLTITNTKFGKKIKIPVVTAVHDDINASIEEGEMDSTKHFIVISVISRI